MFYKSGHSAWRQIVKLANNDFCWLMKQTDNLPFLNFGKEYYFKQFPNLPQRCPIAVGKYYIENVTIFDDKDSFGSHYGMIKTLTSGELPNGVYRHLIKINNKNDPVGLVLYWHTHIYDKMGENSFK